MYHRLLWTNCTPTPAAHSLLRCSIRRYATTRTSSIPKPKLVKPISRSGVSRPPPTSGDLGTASKLVKIGLAERAYDAGTRLVYRAPHRLTFFRLQSWLLAGLATGVIGWFFVDRMFDASMWKSRGISYPRVHQAMYTIIGAFLAGVAGICVYRPGGHIHAIKLVKEADAVFLQLSVRTRLPFIKSRLMVQPYNLLIHPRLAAMRDIPDWMLSRAPNESSPSAFTLGVLANSSRAISRFFFSIFASARQFFLQEGIIQVGLLKEEAGKRHVLTGFYLDADGQYFVQNKSQLLLDMATFKDPHDPDVD